MTGLPNVAVPTLPIAGSADRFPVRRIYCVGQNYADHAREMGSDPDRQRPFFFSKPADALVAGGQPVAFPPRTNDLHHEVELVVALAAGGADIPADKAEALVFGYGVGVDLTRRDLQAAAKSAGRPWDLAKGFDQSAPIGPLTIGIPPSEGAITLSVNGEIRQTGDLDQMIWDVAEIIAELSTYVELKGGDLIFTGTPAGVGRIAAGDKVEGRIAGVEPVEFVLLG